MGICFLREFKPENSLLQIEHMKNPESFCTALAASLTSGTASEILSFFKRRKNTKCRCAFLDKVFLSNSVQK